jgi:hypothetical protein
MPMAQAIGAFSGKVDTDLGFTEIGDSYCPSRLQPTWVVFRKKMRPLKDY